MSDTSILALVCQQSMLKSFFLKWFLSYNISILYLTTNKQFIIFQNNIQYYKNILIKLKLKYMYNYYMYIKISYKISIKKFWNI